MYNGLHYYSISSYLKEHFGKKMVKLTLDGGFTCPNRDGKVGTGGCSFCSQDGSGAFAGTIEEQLDHVPAKWGPDCGYLAYFQNHTNTYAPAGKLRVLWNEALSFPGVEGLVIATRPDCLGESILDLLEEFSRKTFLWVELGLQTESDQTAESFNRCFKTAVLKEAVNNLSKRGIKCVIHLILGLPGEDRAQFLKTAGFVSSLKPFGIKIHMLHVMKDTVLGKQYQEKPFPLLSKEDYISCVCDILEIMPPDVTVHRLTGDAPARALIEPQWTRNKHAVLNGIQKEFKARGTVQGSKYNASNG